MEEWERRKEEGELGSEQEQEEENIYAVSKDQEVCISVRSHWSEGASRKSKSKLPNQCTRRQKKNNNQRSLMA